MIPTISITDILKVVGAIILGVIVLIGFNSCTTLFGNFWTDRDNAIKKTMAHDMNEEYQKVRMEEYKVFMAAEKEHAKELREIYTVQKDEKREADQEYQKQINRDVSGRLDQLDDDLADATMRMQRATERVINEEAELSDWSTVNP